MHLSAVSANEDFPLIDTAVMAMQCTVFIVIYLSGIEFTILIVGFLSVSVSQPNNALFDPFLFRGAPGSELLRISL